MIPDQPIRVKVKPDVEAQKAVVCRLVIGVGPETRVRLGGFESPGQAGWRPRPGQALVWGWDPWKSTDDPD